MNKKKYKIRDRREEADIVTEAPGEIPKNEPFDPVLLEVVDVPPEPDYSKINFFMQANRILVQDFPVPEKVGRFYTPNNREVPVNQGRIVAIGPDVRNLKVGMVISKVYGMGARLTTENGDRYIFLPDSAAIAIDTRFGMGIDDHQAELKKGWVPTDEIRRAGELV